MNRLAIDALKILLTGIVAALGTLGAGWFVYLNQSRELDLKMVDVSLAILSGEKGGKEDKADDAYVLSRTFALRALSKYANVPMGEDDIKAWAKSGAIPHGIFGTPATCSSAADPLAWYKKDIFTSKDVFRDYLNGSSGSIGNCDRPSFVLIDPNFKWPDLTSNEPPSSSSEVPDQSQTMLSQESHAQ